MKNRRGKAPIQAVLFDVGYTLLAPHPSFEELTVETMARVGVHVSAQAVRAVEATAWQHACAVGGGNGFTLTAERSLTFWTCFYRAVLEETGLPCSDALLDALYATFTDRDNYAFYPDVLPAITRLKAQGLRLGLVSNWEDWLSDLLAERNMQHWFAAVVISGREGVEKPDPAIFQLAVDRLGVAPECCLHVGDSVECDVEPAHDMGMTPVLIDRKGRLPECGVPCPRIGSLEDLFNLKIGTDTIF